MQISKSSVSFALMETRTLRHLQQPPLKRWFLHGKKHLFLCNNSNSINAEVTTTKNRVAIFFSVHDVFLSHHEAKGRFSLVSTGCPRTFLYNFNDNYMLLESHQKLTWRSCYWQRGKGENTGDLLHRWMQIGKGMCTSGAQSYRFTSLEKVLKNNNYLFWKEICFGT